MGLSIAVAQHVKQLLANLAVICIQFVHALHTLSQMALLLWQSHSYV